MGKGRTKICQEVDEGVARFYSKNELKATDGETGPGCPKNSIRTSTPRKMPKWLSKGGPDFSYCFGKPSLPKLPKSK